MGHLNTQRRKYETLLNYTDGYGGEARLSAVFAGPVKAMITPDLMYMAEILPHGRVGWGEGGGWKGGERGSSYALQMQRERDANYMVVSASRSTILDYR